MEDIKYNKLLSKNKSKFESRCFTKNEILYANRFDLLRKEYEILFKYNELLYEDYSILNNEKNINLII